MAKNAPKIDLKKALTFEPVKNTISGHIYPIQAQKWPKMPQKWQKMAKKWQKMAKNGLNIDLRQDLFFISGS